MLIQSPSYAAFGMKQCGGVGKERKVGSYGVVVIPGYFGYVIFIRQLFLLEFHTSWRRPVFSSCSQVSQKSQGSINFRYLEDGSEVGVWSVPSFASRWEIIL